MPTPPFPNIVRAARFAAMAAVAGCSAESPAAANTIQVSFMLHFPFSRLIMVPC